MLGGDSFISETPIDFKNPFQTADDQPFQVELGSDSHVKFHVQGIVVRFERLGGRASGNGVHHGRLYLNVIALGKEASDAIEDLGPNQKRFLDLGVDNEIEVALSIPGLNVRQAMPFLWKRTETLG
jgi:hypothetical protein